MASTKSIVDQVADDIAGALAKAIGDLPTELLPKERKAVEDTVEVLKRFMAHGSVDDQRRLSGLESLLKRDRSTMLAEAIAARELAEKASARHREKAASLGRELDRLNRLRPERRGGLPAEWVKSQLAKGETTVFGVPTDSLSFDELRAALIGGATVLREKKVVTLQNSRFRTNEEVKRDAQWLAAVGDLVEVRYE